MNAAPPWRSTTTAPSSTAANGSAAYIPVQARRNLMPTAPVTSSNPTHNADSSQPKPSASGGARNGVEWPPSVRQYVQRCFIPEYQIPSVRREELEGKLKQIITKAAENGSLHDMDWDNLPLPQQMILNERQSAQAASSSSSSSSQRPWASTPLMRDESKAADHSQKRKSSEFESRQDQGSDNTPPWRKTNPRSGYENRTNYGSQTDKRRRLDKLSDSGNSKVVSKFKHNLESRRRRFEDAKSASPSPPPGGSGDFGKANHSTGPIIGTCQTLEKNYFRLTAPPKPENVRPQEVLRKTLDLLKKKWRHEGNYGYICDQFKSMRQDLTVQRIKNEFTVNVYEIHARIALEKGDLGEYNQCQTQLRALYAMQVGGHPTEFKAYRILYFIYTRNQTAINDTLADLTPADKLDGALKHALDVRSALALGNYHRFFQLYLDTPNMGAYLMDMFVDRERLSALACICKTYKPDVKLRFVTEELGFENDKEAVHFILGYAAEELLQQHDDGVKLLTGKVGPVFEQAKSSANRVIDIKGQI